MQSSKTTRLAIEALKKERQRIAIDANLFDLRLACTPHAKRCSERRKEIDVAIAELMGEAAINQKSINRAKKPISLRSAQMELFPE
jgi:hypothetical protein